jgi:hypothetical protein
VSQIRKRLTYANVMSSIAVFLVLGGATAFAASSLGKNTVGSKQLKKNAVTAAKIKNASITTSKIKGGAVTGAQIANGAVTGAQIANGAVTGAKVNLGSLGKVPSAVTADSAATATNATNATNAGNANTVGGNVVRAINFAVDPAVGATQILNLDGFTLTATCPTSTGLTVVANGPAGSLAHTAALTTSSDEKIKDENTTDALTPTTNFNLLANDNDLVNGNTHLDLGTGGRSVTIVWEAESFPLPASPDCTFIGYAIG